MSLSVGIVCHRGVGGSARVAVDLSEALAERGHRVHLFARSAPLGRVALAPGVAFHGLEPAGDTRVDHRLDRHWSPTDVAALAALIGRVVASDGLDVLHFHYAVPFALAVERVVRVGDTAVPATVGTLHGTDVSIPPPREQLGAVGAALRTVDALTTVSRSHAELAADVYGLTALPHVIPNFVDPHRFHPGRRRSGSGGRSARLVHVSNFRRVKDPQAVARVFVEVRRRLDAELWLVGDGEAMPAVRSILRRGRVDGHARSFGLQPRPERIVGACDVLLMMSRSESFCVAALEAAACGIPVVAPRVGGLPEVVVDGRTGLLVPPGDEAAAAAAVDGLLRHHARRAAMGAAATVHARRFHRDAVVARYEALYRRLVAGRATVRCSVPALADG